MVTYTAIAGDEYPARVLAMHGDEADLEVDVGDGTTIRVRRVPRRIEFFQRGAWH